MTTPTRKTEEQWAAEARAFLMNNPRAMDFAGAVVLGLIGAGPAADLYPMEYDLMRHVALAARERFEAVGRRDLKALEPRIR